MCEHSVKTARNLGFAAIVCNRIPALNPAAMNFLTKCGFVPAGEIPRGYRSVKTVTVDPEPVPAADQKKGILGRIFDKKPEPQAPVEKAIVEYFSLYSYLKEV